MYNIVIHNHNEAEVTPLSAEIAELLSYREKSYTKAQGFRYTQKTLLYKGGYFLSGLVPFLSEKVFASVIEDRRSYPQVSLSVPEFRPGFALRSYQIDYLAECCLARRALVKADPGAGKTAIMAGLIATYRLPTLILAPNNTVIAQLKTELCSMLPISMENDQTIGDHHGSPHIMIALARNLVDAPPELLQSYPLLIADEAHSCAAEQAMSVILASQAPFRFGFTATPVGRSDQRDLVVQGLFGPIIDLVDHEQLKQKGFHPSITLDLYYAGWEGDYVYMEDVLVVHNTRRNEQIVQLAQEAGRTGPVLILVRRIEHGRILHALLEKNPPRGKRVYYVDGESSSTERECVREETKADMVGVIIATAVFAQGLDIPELAVGINAGGGKAPILTEQKLGRISRPYGGTIKRWVDFDDNYTTTFRRHSQERALLYRAHVDHVNFRGFPSEREEHLKQLMEGK